MLALTDANFNRLHTCIKANYGIDLNKKKQPIVNRLSNTLTSHDYRGFSEYVDEILTGQGKEMVASMLSKLTTNYMCFLREEVYFQFLRSTVLPSLAKKHAWGETLSMWSTRCSSGEEPYTISMYLRESFGSQASSWDTQILATDISQQILNKVRNLVYREKSLERLSSSQKRKYFVRNKDNTYIIILIIEQNVILQTFNPMSPIHFRRSFDLVFCRNVVTYFNQATKDALVQRFYDTTVPSGYLPTGHSEGLNKAACLYEYPMPTIYQETQH